MNQNQEPKYCIVDENGKVLKNARIANRSTLKAIPDDEPIMIFRAKDIRTYQTIILYMELCKNPGHQRIIQKRAQDFQNFQEQFPERIRETD